MRKLIVALLALFVVLGFADRGLRYLAERAVSHQIASNYQVSPGPDVHAHGFFFLPQVASGHYQQIDINIGKVKRNNVEIDNLRAQMHDVTASMMDMVGHNAKTVTAGEADGSATIPYLSVDDQIPGDLHVVPHGSKLEIIGKVPLMGHNVSVKAILKLGISRTGIIVAAPAKISIGHARIPASMVRKQLTFHVPLVGLPMNLTLTSVRPGKEGLEVAATASNVVFTRATV